MQATAPPLVPAKSPDDTILPSPRSPTKARRLTPSMIIAATGEEALENLEELEIIFGGVSELGSLERCTRLRSLTLIDCGLRRISNLEPVGHSLVKMCLCDQGLRKMEGLCLPGLRELYLHQNKIAKIEGLHGCPSLRRLWLFSNRITAMEGLHHCGALRELWLHGNRITAAAGLESLVHLQNLGLAGNPIGGVRQLSCLRGLPSLAELTLEDIHFGACPVTALEGYRDFVLCCLRQVRRLDGLEVVEADRAEAEEKYEQEALAYQDKLEEIEKRRVREIQHAEMARDGGSKRGSEIKAEMMRALKGLEELVKEGRASMATERSRQEKIEFENLAELELSLLELQKQFCREVDKRVQAEEAKAEEEERLFKALEDRTCLERDYALLVARQQSRGDEGIAVQELSDHSPDFQSLRGEMWANQKTRIGKVELVNVLRACRLYNRRLCEEFRAAAGDSSPTVRLYLGLCASEVEAVCREGVAALGRPAVVLFQDPKQAAEAAVSQEEEEGGMAPGGEVAAASNRANGNGGGGGVGREEGPRRDGAAGLRVVLRLAVALLDKEVDTMEGVVSPSPPRPTGRRGQEGGQQRLLASSRTGSRARAASSSTATRIAGGRGGGGGGGGGSMGILGRVGSSDRVGAHEARRACSSCTRRSSGRGRRQWRHDCSQHNVAVAASSAGRSETVHLALEEDACFVLPRRCFSLALPEFHALCASGAVGEDRRALDDALKELAMGDGVLGSAPEADLLSQLESKMEAQVAAYLERMQQDVTPDEASDLKTTATNMRWKAASLTALRTGVDDERAVQEALLLGEGPRL